MTSIEYRTNFFLEVKIARLQSSMSCARTLAGGTFGGAVVLSPFALAFLFVMPHDQYDPARLLIVFLAGLFFAVSLVAWLVKVALDRSLLTALADRAWA